MSRLQSNRPLEPSIITLLLVVLITIVVVAMLSLGQNRLLVQQITGPAEEAVELPGGMKAKSIELDGRYFLIMEYQGIGIGVPQDISCDTFITKPNDEREYGARFNCPK